jgi:hypothetical protein
MKGRTRREGDILAGRRPRARRTKVRRAAVLAVARNKETTLVPDLIARLEDEVSGVPPPARAALAEVTERDFGPAADASRAEVEQAVADWKAWWKRQADEAGDRAAP